MIIAGITLIGLASAGGLIFAVLSLMGKLHKLRINPQNQWAIPLVMGVAYAVAGLLLYLATIG